MTPIAEQNSRISSFTSKIRQTKQTINKAFNQLRAKLNEQEAKLFARIDQIEQENQKKLNSFKYDIGKIERTVLETIDRWATIQSKKNPIDEMQSIPIIEIQLKKLRDCLKLLDPPTIIDYSFQNLESIERGMSKEIESISILTRSSNA